jgi:YD repeat-containing protein
MNIWTRSRKFVKVEPIRLGLVTRTVVTSELTTTAYARSENGLATSSTVDPGGLALTSTTTYEAPGTGFLRRTGRTLPAGNAWSDAYYGNAETRANPCNTASSANQAGMAKLNTGPDPDGTGPQVPRVEESVYDAAGRVVASRLGTGAWTCMAYDGRGRLVSTVVPALSAEPGRTITTNHALSGNPLVSTTSDPAGTITTTVDLLARVVSYTDAGGNTTTSTYDQAGRLTDTSGPAGAQNSDYDAAGRPTTQRLDGLTVARATYDAAGELAEASYPSGTGNGGNASAGTVSRDGAGRTTGLAWRRADASPLASDTVAYSQGAKVVEQSIDGLDADPPVPTSPTTAPGGCGPPESPATASATTSPPLPGARSLLRRHGTPTARPPWKNGVTTTYCYDAADKLVSTTDTRYANPAYDARGNTTALGAQTLGYDGADRHVVTTTGGTTLRYRRDATDRIVAREVTAPEPSASSIALRAATSASNGAGATSLTLTKPTGTVEGDVMVAQVAVAGGSGTSTATPSGWTKIDGKNNSTSVRSVAYYRVATATEPASWSFGFGSSQDAAGGIAAYSGVKAASVVNAFASGTASSTTAHPAPSVSTTEAGTMVVAMFGLKQGITLSPPEGMAERWDTASTGATASNRITASLADAPQAASGATGTRTATSATAGSSATHLVALTPGAPPTSTEPTGPVRYGYSAGGDTSDFTLDANNVVVERITSLLGGVLVTKRAPGDTWSYPNVHGDVMASADATGAKQGATLSYDPTARPSEDCRTTPPATSTTAGWGATSEGWSTKPASPPPRWGPGSTCRAWAGSWRSTRSRLGRRMTTSTASATRSTA